MAETKVKSKSWPKIGTVRKGDSGNYLKLEDGIEIYLNGEKLPMNSKKTVRLEKPQTKVEQLFERGFIDEKEHDKRLEQLAQNSWLLYEMILAPPKPESK